MAMAIARRLLLCFIGYEARLRWGCQVPIIVDCSVVDIRFRTLWWHLTMMVWLFSGSIFHPKSVLAYWNPRWSYTARVSWFSAQVGVASSVEHRASSSSNTNTN